LDNYILKIVGSGPLEIKLKKIVEDNNIKNVHFLGYKDNVEKYYQEFDALILTSTMEGVPISILEAMSYGLPIFTTPVGQIRNYLSGNDGIYFLSLNLREDIKLLQKTKLDRFLNLIEFIEKNHNLLKVRENFFKLLNDDASLFEEYDYISGLLSCEYI
jgi:glycosyltransferase involved in cell wall biosynthesis